MSLIPDVLLKMKTLEDVTTEMFKRFHFRSPFDGHDVKVSEPLLKSAQQNFYPFVWSTWKRLTLKTSLLVISEVLGLFANTLIVDNKYSPQNLPQPIEMELFKNPKTFFQFFAAYLKSI